MGAPLNWYLTWGGVLFLLGIVLVAAVTAWLHPEYFPSLVDLLTEKKEIDKFKRLP